MVSWRGAGKKVNREAAEVWSETREREHHRRNRGKGGGAESNLIYTVGMKNGGEVAGRVRQTGR